MIKAVVKYKKSAMRCSSFRKFASLFLTVGFVLVGLVFVQHVSAGGGGNTSFNSATVAGDDSYIDVTFSTAVWGNAGKTTPVASSSLDIYDGGHVATTTVQIISVSKTDGNPLVGGEPTIRVLINKGDVVYNTNYNIGNAASYSIYGTNGVIVNTGQLQILFHSSTAPRVVLGALATDNSYIDVTFNKGVWGNASTSTPVLSGAFIPVFSQNGGNATGASISSVKKTNGLDDLAGGETTIRAFLDITGVPNGSETITINLFGVNLFFGEDGSSDGYTGTTGPISLHAAPTIDIGAPSLAIASSTSSVIYTITYGGATGVTLASGDITLDVTGTATGAVSVSGTGTSTRTVTVSHISGNGTLGITIAAGTATNNEGVLAPGAGPGTTFIVDTTEFSITDNFYDANTFVESNGYLGSTIHGHWVDNANIASIAFNVQNTAIGQYWDFGGGWQSTPVAGISGFFGDDGLGGMNWWPASSVPASMFEDWTTYIFTLTLIDTVGNTTQVSDSFTWGAQEFNPDNIGTLFTLPEGGVPTDTTQLTANDNIGSMAASYAGMGGVMIPVGTVITKDDGSAFDATAIAAINDTNVVLGSSLMTAGVTLQGAVQFGISNVTLHFSAPVVVRIPVTVPNSTSLDIRRSPDGGATWTTTGFTANATDTCLNGNGSHPVTTTVIAGGFATIFTCQASDFATYSYSQPSSSYYYGGTPTATTSTSTATIAITITATTTASTTPSLSPQDLLASLIAQLKALILQAKAQGIAVSPTAEAFIQGNYSFTHDLKLGTTGEDVRQLQIYLNSKGFTVALSGPGSPGNETTYFGSATKSALIKFQKASGISPVSGYFGPKTRAYIGLHP